MTIKPTLNHADAEIITQIVDDRLEVKLEEKLDQKLKKYPTRTEMNAAINKLPTFDDVRTIMKQELKDYATKKDVEKLEKKIDDMGKTIVDVIERAMDTKTDKTQVNALEIRVTSLEQLLKN